MPEANFFTPSECGRYVPSTTDTVKARVHKVLKSLGIVVGIWFWAALVGMFVEGHLPFLHPFVTWTFRVYLGVFAAGAVGLVVVAPGVYMAKEIYEAVTDLRASKLRRGALLTFGSDVQDSYSLSFWAERLR